MKIKVKDIAQKLNISSATVSLAIHNKPGVGEETRKRILAAARQMGYARSIKKSAASNTGYTIQFVIFKQPATSGLDTSFFSYMMEGVERHTGLNGGSLLITHVNTGDSMAEKIASLCAGGSRGVILLATELTPAHIDSFLSVSLPMVVLDAYFEQLPLDCVTINNAQGAYQAVSYLANMGHSKIGYLSSTVRTVNFAERQEGFCNALSKLNLQKRTDFFFPLTPSIMGACADMKEALRTNPELPTAFFADNDILAAGAMRAFKEVGLRVPEDISLVGFDDIPLCTLTEPALTTISVPKARLGALAVERLYHKMNHPPQEFVKIEVGTKLVERSSVKRL